ncbi:MAG: cytochrome C, partial [Desulfobacteraceae bacterium]
KAMAGAMLKARKPVTGSFKAEDIPEKVSIKKFSNKYEAAEFPHRKILNTLVKNIKDNRLAGYFHIEDGTLCQGCHHNSPVAKKPPLCDSCHGKPFDPENPLKPGIMGAYHQQCMGCHKEMGIAKPVGCTECHKEKKI